MPYFFAFMTALVSTLLLVPPIKKLAFVTGVMDRPEKRKIHTSHVPRLGGLAIFLGFLISIFAQGPEIASLRGVLFGMTVIVIVGILDDAMNLPAKAKLVGQIVAAAGAILISGLEIQFLGSVLGNHVALGWLSFPLTVIWIVGITNAINLSDGLDGLASGISLIGFLSFGFLAYQRGDSTILLLCLILAGCILGFLKYNTHPAEIFMGDTGSMFLGFSLGVISTMGHFKSLTAVTLFTPILVLFVPISDTLWAIFRRLREGRSPFSPDKKHFHHLLLNRGMDQVQSVSVIYAISAMLSLTAVLLANSSKFKFLFIPLVLLTGVLLVLQSLKKINLLKPVYWLSHLLDQWISLQLHRIGFTLGLSAISCGIFLYLCLFASALTQSSPQILAVAATVLLLVMYLTVTERDQQKGFLIFSMSFLAITLTAVVQLHLSHQGDLNATNSTLSRWLFQSFSLLEPAAFWALVIGVFAKIIFKRKAEIILSTPLEFFVFLSFISLSLFPSEILESYQLVPLTLRSVFLFLGLKIMVLHLSGVTRTTWLLAISSGMALVFGIFL
jgi:UDP-GlcNAc:undecaprenyl-phosphate GlcNAc-1-phosphate transferase